MKGEQRIGKEAIPNTGNQYHIKGIRDHYGQLVRIVFLAVMSLVSTYFRR